MSKSRRSFIFATAALPFAFSGKQTFAQQTQLSLSADEIKVADYLKEHGVSHFVMFNKKRGQILFIENGQITQHAKVLSGKTPGDNDRDNLGVTPAGIFILRPFGDGKHIGFKETGENIDYAIHTIINPRGQNRPQRLASNKAEFKRISAGCINASQETMDHLHNFIDKHQEVFREDNGNPLVMGTHFVVLPEMKPVQSILKYPEYTTR